jgi:hypothetical protein
MLELAIVAHNLMLIAGVMLIHGIAAESADSACK